MKKEKPTLKLKDLLNNGFCMRTSDGDFVHDRLAEMLRNTEEDILVDFEGIDLATTAFLQAAFGQLYKENPSGKLERVKTINIHPAQTILLDRVIDIAKHYYTNSNTFENNAKKHFGK